MSEKYNVIFSGNITPGADGQKVRDNTAKVFNASAEQLVTLFSGKPVVLKSNLSQNEAETFREKLKRIGLVCDIKVKNQPSEVPQQPDTPSSQQIKQESKEEDPAPPVLTERVKAEPKPAKDGSLSLAPAGAEIDPLKSTEHPLSPDTSQLGLASEEGFLVESDSTPPPEAPDTSKLSLKK